MKRYRWHTGTVAYILHRLTGLGLTAYIFMHIFALHSLKDEAAFEAEMKLFSHPIVKVMEIALLAVLLYHAMNGIRILIVDFGKGAYNHKQLYWVFMALFVVLLAVGAYPIIAHF